MRKKLLSIAAMIALAVTCFGVTVVPAQAKGTIRVYSTYASQVKSISKSGNKLTIRLNRDSQYATQFSVFNKKEKLLSEKGGWKKTFRLTKNCQWLSASVVTTPNTTFYERKTATKISYSKFSKEHKDYLKSAKNDDYWEYGILVFTRDGKAYKVVERFS